MATKKKAPEPVEVAPGPVENIPDPAATRDPRAALLARKDARRALQGLADDLAAALATGAAVSAICNDIHALSEVADD